MKLKIWIGRDWVCVKMGELWGTSKCHWNDPFDPKIGIVVACLKATSAVPPFSYVFLKRPTHEVDLASGPSMVIESERLQMQRLEGRLAALGLKDAIGDARLVKAIRTVKILDSAFT